MTDALMAQGIVKHMNPGESSRNLESAEMELSRQLDRLDGVVSSLDGRLDRVLKSQKSDVSPGGTIIDMDSSIGYLVMSTADRIRVANNRLEEIYGRVDL